MDPIRPLVHHTLESLGLPVAWPTGSVWLLSGEQERIIDARLLARP